MPVVYLHAKTSQIVRFVYSVLFFCPFVLNAQINWDVNANQFEHSMTITCVVENDLGNYYQESISIGVFDGQTCVGVAVTDTYFPPSNVNLAFLVVYSNQSNASYTLKVQVDELVLDAGTLSFVSNGVLGTLDSPFVVSPVFSILGCTDSTALNYNPDALEDNGSCIEIVLGCTDLAAYNFDSNANSDDGSCISITMGCMNDAYLEYNALANAGNQDDLCTTEIVLGCLDDDYVSYNFLANTDDQSCVLTWQDAYLTLLESCENTISISLPSGWSFFGYFLNEPLPINEATFCITQEIIIIKNYNGSVYLPEYNFNGIGSLEPGLGYQIKLSTPIAGFHFCN